MKKKLISIIVNCYNGEKYLYQTLQSILNQKYKNFEVIFVDNCSTDFSSKIYKKIRDKRFRYFKTKKKIKLYDSRNFALKKCKGSFVAFLDTDDWWDKDFLSLKKNFFSSSKDYAFSFSNCNYFYENKKNTKVFYKKELPSGFILNNLIEYYFVNLSTLIIKKKVMKKFRFNSNYNIIGDFDLVLRMSKNYKAMAFQDNQATIRIHSNNFSHNNRKMFYQEYKNWANNQNYNNHFFKKNKKNIFLKLEYLKIIYLLLENKKINHIFDIIRYPDFFLKMKLLLIYFLPKFFIKLKFKYF
jgi:glycosyltransferase involved in cell wall biosynthesis